MRVRRPRNRSLEDSFAIRHLRLPAYTSRTLWRACVVVRPSYISRLAWTPEGSSCAARGEAQGPTQCRRMTSRVRLPLEGPDGYRSRHFAAPRTSSGHDVGDFMMLSAPEPMRTSTPPLLVGTSGAARTGALRRSQSADQASTSRPRSLAPRSEPVLLMLWLGRFAARRAKHSERSRFPVVAVEGIIISFRSRRRWVRLRQRRCFGRGRGGFLSRESGRFAGCRGRAASWFGRGRAGGRRGRRRRRRGRGRVRRQGGGLGRDLGDLRRGDRL